MKPLSLFFFLFCVFISATVFPQCSTLSTLNKGTLTPTSTSQNASASSGFRNYWSFTGVAGCTYTFRTCSNTTKDTYLRLYNSGWTQVASNDDACSSQSSVSYTPVTTGVYYIFLTEFSCIPITANYNLTYYNSGSCTVETCSDGIMNQTETNVDCGGPCQACGAGGAGTACAGTTLIYEDLFNGSAAGPFNSAGPTLKSGRGTSNTEWTFNKGWTTYHNHQWTGEAIRFNPDNGVNCEEGTNMIYKRFTSLTPGSGEAAANGYNTVLTANTETLEWSFMAYFDDPPSGLSNGNGVTIGGGAFVIGMQNNVIYSCTQKNYGYAVIFGDANNANSYLQLVRFSGNNNSGSSPCQPYEYLIFNRPEYQNTTCVVSGNTPIPAGWTAVKVQYNPANDEWRLFARYNVSSTFDPRSLGSLSSDGHGGKIDATYTNLDLSYFGFYSCFADDATLFTQYDNLRVRKNVCLLTSVNNSGGLNCGETTVLPVELEEYRISCENSRIQLNWITASEHNSEKFYIERLSEEGEFEVIGDVTAAGNSQDRINYTFIDNNPVRGMSYYRLSQIDHDGIKTDLGTLSTEWPCKDPSNEVQLFPNPTEDDVNLVITRGDREDYSVQMYNSVGQSVIPSIEEDGKDKGTTMLKLRTNELSAGVYLIKVIVGEKVYTEKLIIKQ